MIVPKVVLPYNRCYNFSAGPSALPLSIIEKTRDEQMNFCNSGRSMLEINHRDKLYVDVFERTRQSLRKLLAVPDNYEILLLQGGGRMMFAATVLNLFTPAKDGGKPTIDYIVTGFWSDRCADEVRKKFSDYVNVHIVVKGDSSKIPDPSTWNFSPNPIFIHYTTNETVNGLQFFTVPTFPPGAVVVADASSDILSKPLDVSKFGVIYASAQKNGGVSGVTIAIVRKDLLVGRGMSVTPSPISFKDQYDRKSMKNTPPTYSIYVCGLYYDYLLGLGGLEIIQKMNEEKAKLVYDVINSSGGYYQLHVTDPTQQSQMNVVFRIWGGGVQDADRMTPHERKFVAEAAKAGFVGLQGHHDAGGIRVSLYNAVTLEAVKALCCFLVEFQKACPPQV